jgi:hypothetical protein
MADFEKPVTRDGGSGRCIARRSGLRHHLFG